MSVLTEDKINHMDNPREPRGQLLELRRERWGLDWQETPDDGHSCEDSIRAVRYLGINPRDVSDSREEDYKTL